LRPLTRPGVSGLAGATFKSAALPRGARGRCVGIVPRGTFSNNPAESEGYHRSCRSGVGDFVKSGAWRWRYSAALAAPRRGVRSDGSSRKLSGSCATAAAMSWSVRASMRAQSVFPGRSSAEALTVDRLFIAVRLPGTYNPSAAVAPCEGRRRPRSVCSAGSWIRRRPGRPVGGGAAKPDRRAGFARNLNSFSLPSPRTRRLCRRPGPLHRRDGFEDVGTKAANETSRTALRGCKR